MLRSRTGRLTHAKLNAAGWLHIADHVVHGVQHTQYFFTRPRIGISSAAKPSGHLALRPFGTEGADRDGNICLRKLLHLLVLLHLLPRHAGIVCALLHSNAVIFVHEILRQTTNVNMALVTKQPGFTFCT